MTTNSPFIGTRFEVGDLLYPPKGKVRNSFETICNILQPQDDDPELLADVAIEAAGPFTRAKHMNMSDALQRANDRRKKPTIWRKKLECAKEEQALMARCERDLLDAADRLPHLIDPLIINPRPLERFVANPNNKTAAK